MSQKRLSHDVVSALIELGLTELEAQAYAFLLHGSPATGYRVSQALGRPFGAVYKALEGLEGKGAILAATDATTRHVRAVPLSEFLDQLDRRFQSRRSALLTTQDAADDNVDDDLVYPLRDADQLFHRARAMLRRAKHVVLVTACPAPLAALRTEIIAAAKRGVAVGVKVFEPAELGKSKVIVDLRGLAAIESGPGEWLAINSDAREHLSALFSADDQSLLRGTWCGGVFQSWLNFTGLSSDHVLAALRPRVRANASARELSGILDDLSPLETARSPGKLRLVEQYRRAIRPREKRDS